MASERFTWPGYNGDSPAHQTLQGFIILDVQASPDYADEIRTGIQAYCQGKIPQFDGSGNGYEFECHPDGFWINCLYEGDPLTPVTVDYATVLQALDAWVMILQSA